MLAYLIALAIARAEIPSFDSLPMLEQVCLVCGYQANGLGWDPGYESDCVPEE